ncbi:MAG: hypothetical protein LBK08_00755 [Treponema sp.]|nr:hypothetical protein [Treponema sp.]
MKTMVNKRVWLGVLVIVLVLGMTVLGCSSTPKSFIKGSVGDTTVLLRNGIDFDLAFREVAFLLNRHGFETETIQPEVGYIRTRWSSWDSTTTIDAYRVRIICNFNPARTQLIVKAEAEYRVKGGWVSGYDTRAIETLRTDLNNVVGN